MKTPLLALLNSIGFANAAQKCMYAAHLLRAALTNSPAITVRKKVAAKAAVAYRPAYPARAASAAIPASPSNPAIAANTLFFGQAAIAAGAAVPAFPAKAATPEVLAQAAVAAVTELKSPEIKALLGWADAVTIVESAASISIEVYLPVSHGVELLGGSSETIEALGEITPPVASSDWLDTKASSTPDTSLAEPLTLEQYFAKHAIAFLADGGTGTDTFVNKMVGTYSVACRKFNLMLPTNGSFDPSLASIQLDKIGNQIGGT